MPPRSTLILFIGFHVLCCLPCLGPGAAAQTRIGVTGGLNWSTFGGDTPQDAEYKRALGFNAGFVGDIALTEDVSLSFQPMVVRRGANIHFDVGEEEPRDSLELRLDYIDCLVMVKVFADNDLTYFTSGVGVGFLTGATLDDIRAGEEDVESAFEDIDFSIAFGVGFMVPAGGTLVTIELRYQQSLTNSIDAAASMEALAPRVRSSGFQLLAAVLFPRLGWPR